MIFLILVLALILRLINLNQSLWLDEAVQAITAQKSVSYIFQEIVGDFHPPLYHFLMHYWVRVFGDSEMLLRMPSVLFGVGTVYFVYRISNLSRLRNLRYLSSILLATAPFHIYYSQEARLYSMSAFLASLSFYFFMKLRIFNEEYQISNIKYQKQNLKLKNFDINNFFYFISTLLLIYTDYYGFLVLLAQGIYFLTKKKYKFLLLNTFFLILCYLPWLPMFITQIKTGMLATQSLPEWGKLVNVSFIKALPLTFIKFSLGRITIFDKKVYAIVSAGIFVLIGILFGNIVKSNIKYQNSKPQLKTQNDFLLICLWFFIPLLVSWLASLIVPNFQPFRLLLILPAFYLLLTMGIEELGGNRWIRETTIATFLIINLISLSVYYFNPYFHREDWRGLVNYLNQMEKPKVILPSGASSWPIGYYDRNNNINLITGADGAMTVSKPIETGGTTGNEIYYIRYLVPVFDPEEKILASMDKEGYTKEKEISFNQIPVWKFTRAADSRLRPPIRRDFGGQESLLKQ